MEVFLPPWPGGQVDVPPFSDTGREHIAPILTFCLRPTKKDAHHLMTIFGIPDRTNLVSKMS